MCRFYHGRVTHYEVLGVPRSATAAEVRRAYLDLARRHHPDFHTRASAAAKAETEREMQRINDAWAVLGDQTKRRAYDDMLRAVEPGRRSATGTVAPDPDPVWDPRGGRAHPDFVPIDDDEDEDDPNARLDELDDTPMPGARPVARWQQMLPVVLFVAALAALVVGLVVNLPELMVVGVFLFVLAGASFLLAPILALLTGYERDPRK